MGQKILRCSFCKKDQNEVRKLIAGPRVFICDACVEICNDIIADDSKFESSDQAVRGPLAHPSCGLCGSGATYDFPNEAALLPPHVTLRDGRTVCGGCLQLIREAMEPPTGQ
jgi:hypothetical protein